MGLDIYIFYFLNNLVLQSANADVVIVFLAKYLIFALIAFFGLVVIFSEYNRRQKITFILVPLIAGIISRFGVTEIIRFFYNRPRPFVTHTVHQLIIDNTYSFPSGHAMFLFAFGVVIYLFNKKWGIIFLTVSLFIIVSRVIAGVHYPSDIIAGAIMGAIIGYLSVYIYRLIAKSYSLIN